MDGYTLLTLNEEDMILSLHITQLCERQVLSKAIKKLVILWINFGKDSDAFFRDQVDSIYFDEQTVIQRSFLGNSSSFNITELLDRDTLFQHSGDSEGHDQYDSMLNESTLGQQL